MEGIKRGGFELSGDDAESSVLACVEGKFAVPAPFWHVRYGFMFRLGWLLKSKKSSANLATSTFSGMTR